MLIVIGIQFFSIGLLGELMAKANHNNENRIKYSKDDNQLKNKDWNWLFALLPKPSKRLVSFFKKKFQSILGKYPISRIDFIIAGTQKGGTTALYEYFRSHQNICMADKKELHFFDEDRYFVKKNPNILL